MPIDANVDVFRGKDKLEEQDRVMLHTIGNITLKNMSINDFLTSSSTERMSTTAKMTSPWSRIGRTSRNILPVKWRVPSDTRGR